MALNWTVLMKALMQWATAGKTCWEFVPIRERLFVQFVRV